MKRILSPVLSLALLLGALGPGCIRAVAQVAQVPASVGAGLGGAGTAGAGSVQTTFGALGVGPANFNDPRFFVLQTLSNQLDVLTVAKPMTFVRSVEALLRAPETVANPSSPQALAARVIARALRSPGGVKLLEPTLLSIHPALGASVAAKLDEAARQIRRANGGTPGALESLARAAELLETARPGAGSGAPDGQLVLDQVFLGRLASKNGGSPGADQPGLTVYAEGPNLSLHLPDGAARLRPAPKPQSSAYGLFLERLPIDGEFSVRVEDLDAAMTRLRGQSVPDAVFSDTVRRLAELNGDLPLDERRTFLIRREPELLELLKMPDTANGAARVLTDGRRSLSILIVAVPSRGMTQGELAEVLLHEAQHAADHGVFGVPTAEPLSHLLLEGYTQKRTQERLLRARAVLDLKDEPNTRYVDELRLAESLLQAVGRKPLDRLVSRGDDSALRETLGARWTYLRVLAGVAADHPSRKSAFFQALGRVIHLPEYSPADFQATLARTFPDVPADRLARAAAQAQTPLSWARRVRRWWSDLVALLLRALSQYQTRRQ